MLSWWTNNMKLFTASICVFLSTAAANAAEPTKMFLAKPEHMILLNSPEGRSMLTESRYSEDYWQLSQFFSIQPDIGTCGVATSTTVLNALGVERPNSEPHGKFKLFTAANFFSKEVTAIKSSENVSRSGLSLEQLGKAIESHNATAKVVYASSSSVDEFRRLLKKVLAEKSEFMVVNYLRKEVGQSSGGHISPVGAYHASSDRVLIMDTSSYKYPFVWVETARLWKAMSVGVDSSSQQTRGFVTVSKK